VGHVSLVFLRRREDRVTATVLNCRGSWGVDIHNPRVLVSDSLVLQEEKKAEEEARAVLLRRFRDQTRTKGHP
jgi:hypothetical protein